jgi:hypothetical protein
MIMETIIILIVDAFVMSTAGVERNPRYPGPIPVPHPNYLQPASPAVGMI